MSKVKSEKWQVTVSPDLDSRLNSVCVRLGLSPQELIRVVMGAYCNKVLMQIIDGKGHFLDALA